ncbi:MAG: DUF2497 domain-containing protein [Hyphomicrobiales bacterium]|nr:DUF2497 domain-containing protein [Hyphomicrobiales bacterium]
MTQPAKAQEPTMEEILASIRRIIADDDGVKTQPKASEPPPLAAAALRPDPVPPPRVPAPSSPAAKVQPDPTAAEEAEIEAMLSELNSAPPSEAEPPGASDVLELTESMAEPSPPPTNGFRTIDGQSDIEFEEPREPVRPPVSRPAGPESEALISAATSAVVDSAFNTLAHTVLVQNARTLEDLVREMLRPMLKTWLDDNLPGLVERLVRAEIERVSRGRG